MQTLDSDDFLWEMAASEEAELASPSDAELRAYLHGNLDPEAQTDLETHLARSPDGRQRLVELTGVQLDGPAARVREQVLAHLPQKVQAKPNPRAAPRRLRSRWLAAAAVIALLVVGYQFLSPLLNDPDVAQIAVQAIGIKPDRSSGFNLQPGEPHSFRAFAGTEITIKVTLPGEPVRKTEVGLYLLHSDRLERIEIPVIATRTCTDFVATARELVGEQPGSYALFVVAGLPGELPARVALEGREPSRALAQESNGQVQPVAPLELLAEPSPG